MSMPTIVGNAPRPHAWSTHKGPMPLQQPTGLCRPGGETPVSSREVLFGDHESPYRRPVRPPRLLQTGAVHTFGTGFLASGDPPRRQGWAPAREAGPPGPQDPDMRCPDFSSTRSPEVLTLSRDRLFVPSRFLTAPGPVEGPRGPRTTRSLRRDFSMMSEAWIKK